MDFDCIKERKRRVFIQHHFIYYVLSQSAQAWITQFYLQVHHACLSFVSVHQMAPPLTQVENIQLAAYYSSIDPKGMKG